MWTLCRLLLLLLSFRTELLADPDDRKDLLSLTEQTSLQKAGSLDQRLKVYLTAGNTRIKKAADSRENETREAFSSQMEQYQEILRICNELLDKNPPLKARQAKHQEITLRKQIQFLNDLFARVDMTDQGLIRQATTSAHSLRNRFLKLFFGSETIKQ
jgi:hypothetical protein